MLQDNYNILVDLLNSFKKDLSDLNMRIQTNILLMKEEDACINDLENPGPDDISIFYPRKITTPLQREEAEKARVRKMNYEKENEKLITLIDPLKDRIGKIEKVLSSELGNMKTDGLNAENIDGDKIECLTNKEKDILVCVAQGMINKEIASSLSISERTVKNHLSSIFKKIDVSDRTQAALFAIKNNLVNLSD